MDNNSSSKYHQANKKRWEASAQRWGEMADSRGIWKECHQNPSLVFSDKVLHYTEHIAGKQVCVLGSGDNQAVFALAGMGANVTSVDISQNQLDIAEARAKILGFDISFIQSDVTNLEQLLDQSFDLVYTGGHVAVWVADLQQYYQEATRILKPGGLFIVDEYHPFRRIWKEDWSVLEIENSYFQKGPFQYQLDTDILIPNEGDFASYEFHWRVSDFVNAMIKAGNKIVEIDEYGEQVCDWERTNFKGLPENLLIVAEKG